MEKSTWWIIAGVAIVIVIALFVAMGSRDNTDRTNSDVSTTTEEVATTTVEVE